MPWCISTQPSVSQFWKDIPITGLVSYKHITKINVFDIRKWNYIRKFPSSPSVKVVHKEFSKFLNQFFPTPCLYHELNMIIHASYINL